MPPPGIEGTPSPADLSDSGRPPPDDPFGGLLLDEPDLDGPITTSHPFSMPLDAASGDRASVPEPPSQRPLTDQLPDRLPDRLPDPRLDRLPDALPDSLPDALPDALPDVRQDRPAHDPVLDLDLELEMPELDDMPGVLRFSPASDPDSASAPADGPELRLEAPRVDPADPRTAGGGAGVYAERVRARVDAVSSALPDALPPDPTKRLARLVSELASCGPEVDEPVRKRVLACGPEVLPTLCRAFPGAVWVDLSRPHRPLRSARSLSGVGAALVDFGDAAAPHVAQLLRDPRANVRMAACVVATDLAHADLVRPLAARLHDQRTLIRNAAMSALRACRALPEYRELRHELCEGLVDSGAPVEWRRRAAWTLGQLRDGAAVPALIEGLAAEAPVAEACRASLVRVIGIDLGRFRFRWRRWWSKNQRHERTLWLIEALDQSDDALRVQASEELVLWTGEGFDRRHATATREQARELADFFRDALSLT